MAISKISFKRDDNNLNAPIEGQDHISAMIFDVSTFPGKSSDGDIFQVFDINDAETLGVTAYDGTAGATNYEFGIPHLHISEFFRLNPGGSLYISFANCSSNFDIIEQVQSMAQGNIRQVGVWTRQKMLVAGATTSDPYTVQLISDLQKKANALAKINQPISVLLSANLTSIDAAGDTTSLTLLPSVISTNDRVTALIGQGASSLVHSIQKADSTHATVGCVGAILGLVARSQVGTSIAWVQQFDMSGGEMDLVELGFGDITVDSDGNLTNVYPIESITTAQMDEIEEKGYVYPIKHVGLAGTYASSSRTCASNDFRTIERNRAIDKSRRAIRAALLPFLNAPVKIAPSTGQIAASDLKVYALACTNVLDVMAEAGDISGSKVQIDPTQNILESDTLKIKYIIVPNAKSSNINITEGYALTTN